MKQLLASNILKPEEEDISYSCSLSCKNTLNFTGQVRIGEDLQRASRKQDSSKRCVEPSGGLQRSNKGRSVALEEFNNP